MRRSLLAAVSLIVLAAPAMAQETGTPVFLGPDRLFQKSAFGISMSDPGSGIAIEGYYRMASNPKSDFGFRLGFADPGGDANTAFLLGADYRMRLLNHTEDFPLDGALILGAGGSLVEGNNALLIPIGFSMGRKILLENSTTSFVPYFTPTVIPTFADDSDVNFAVGLGVDMQFGSKFDLNVSGSFGDLDGISVSFSWLH
jgi:opacity protein-like surface antigen